jgi:ABC-type nickel/cobalt efflux system permease component RcnA
MSSLLAVTVLGFFLGIRHAADPDHVIAVTTIVSRHGSPVRAALVGVLWGVGHSLTILVVGAGIVLLGWVIPPRVGLSLELSVGVMLTVLGILNLRAVLWEARGASAVAGHSSGVVHTHAHAHGDYVHTHPHQHRPEGHPHRPEDTPLARLDRLLGGLRPYDLLRPLIVGILHGLAGSAAVALLVLTAIGTSAWVVAYLLLFGLGTIIGMMLITVGLAWPLAGLTPRFANLPRRLRLATGVISLIAGLAITYQIGVVDGLFGAAPRWTPK